MQARWAVPATRPAVDLRRALVSLAFGTALLLGGCHLLFPFTAGDPGRDGVSDADAGEGEDARPGQDGGGDSDGPLADATAGDGQDAGGADLAAVDANPADGGPGGVTVPGATFNMGCAVSEWCYWKSEQQHPVQLTHDFLIAATEVTRAAFSQLLGYDPSLASACVTCPVDHVSWDEAAAFCNALSGQAGLTPCYDCSGTGQSILCTTAPAFSGALIYSCPGYRLPTDAEWERAYRGTTTTEFYSGAAISCDVDPNADLIGWYAANSGNAIHPVGQKQPNEFGLFDMAGNVWEWVHDYYQEDLGTALVTDPWGAAAGERMVRGGSYSSDAIDLRACYRRNSSKIPDALTASIGFRWARTLAP